MRELFSNNEGLFRFYWRTILRHYAWQAALLAVLMMAAAIMQMIAIGLAVPALEVVAGGADSSGRVVDAFRSAISAAGFQPANNVVILAILVSASVLFVVYSGFTLANLYFSTVVGESLRRETKSNLFQRFLLAQHETVSQRGRGMILHDLTDPPLAVNLAISRLSLLFTAVFNSLVLLALMLYLSWWATLFIGILGLLAVHGVRRLTDAKARRAGETIHTLQADQARLGIDAIDGLKIIKAHGLERILSLRLMSLLKKEVRPAHRVAFFRHFPAFVNEFAAGIIVIILSGVTLLAPFLGLSFATLVAFLMAIRQCGASIANISFAIVDLQALRPRVRVLLEVQQKLPPEQSGTGAVRAVSELRFANVSLHYASREGALRNVSLSMKKGTVTAIVGPTGSGKSTIASLIVGLYPPSAGSILVDGKNLADLSLPEWRNRIGYVPQDPFLFNTSIRDNIALWDETISQQEIDRAAQLAQLHDFVRTLPNGYDTRAGDRGLELSGGQAQRVAIARAILRKPEVLVFDEATSALDNLTEQAVYEAITALRPNAIIIVIAHRLSTVRDADQIVVIEAGSIVEIGTHDSLMGDGGSYSKLYRTESVHG